MRYCKIKSVFVLYFFYCYSWPFCEIDINNVQWVSADHHGSGEDRIAGAEAESGKCFWNLFHFKEL